MLLQIRISPALARRCSLDAMLTAMPIEVVPFCESTPEFPKHLSRGNTDADVQPETASGIKRHVDLDGFFLHVDGRLNGLDRVIGMQGPGAPKTAMMLSPMCLSMVPLC